MTTDRGPLSEAAFLSRASNFTLELEREEYQSDHRFDYRCVDGTDCRATHYGRSADNNRATLGFEYYRPHSWLYLAGSYQYLERNQDSWANVEGQDVHYDYTSDHEYWSASLGITPLDGWLLATQFGEGGDGELFEGDFNVSSKYVWQLGGGRALNVEGAYFVDNSYNDWRLGADYYFNKTLSLGASIGDDKTSEIRLKKYLTDSISLEASYWDYDGGYSYRYGVGDNPGDGFSVGMSVRF